MMLFTLRKIIHNLLADAHSAAAFASYRLRQANRQVNIHRHANIHGSKAIEIGLDTSIHPDATVAATFLNINDRFTTRPAGKITIGKRCHVFPGAKIITYGGTINIGDDVTVNPYTILYGDGGLTIGSGTRIAAHCMIIPANHNFKDPDTPIHKQGCSAKGIDIGPDVWIGAGVKILDGVTIGKGAVIGAGTIVNRDIKPFDIAVGVPVKIVGSRLNNTANTVREAA